MLYHCPTWSALDILETVKRNVGVGQCTHFAAVFVAFAAACLPSTGAPDGATPLPLLDAALRACEDLDALGCQGRLREVAARLPEEALPRFYLGLVAQQGLNDGNEAMARYEEAFALDPTHVDTLCNLGKARSDRSHAFAESDPSGAARDAADAEALWLRALELDPLHRMARVNTALRLHAAGRFDDAVREWRAVLAARPEDVEALYNVAVSLQHLGDVMGAAEAYGDALALDEDYVEARINVAALHHKHGSVSDAVAHYERALASLERRGVGPLGTPRGGTGEAETAVMILNNLGVALYQLGDFGAAVGRHDGPHVHPLPGR